MQDVVDLLDVVLVHGVQFCVFRSTLDYLRTTLRVASTLLHFGHVDCLTARKRLQYRHAHLFVGVVEEAVFKSDDRAD